MDFCAPKSSFSGKSDAFEKHKNGNKFDISASNSLFSVWMDALKCGVSRQNIYLTVEERSNKEKSELLGKSQKVRKVNFARSSKIK